MQALVSCLHFNINSPTVAILQNCCYVCIYMMTSDDGTLVTGFNFAVAIYGIECK